jgi:hypothetical protein
MKVEFMQLSMSLVAAVIQAKKSGLIEKPLSTANLLDEAAEMMEQIAKDPTSLTDPKFAENYAVVYTLLSAASLLFAGRESKDAQDFIEVLETVYAAMSQRQPTNRTH